MVCLIDPVGDVYACPFAIHENFLAGNIVSGGGFQEIWQNSDLFTELREPQNAGACTKCAHFDACRGGCMAAKFFTGLPLAGPDPECVQGYGEELLAGERTKPTANKDHSRGTPLTLMTRKPDGVLLPIGAPPSKSCDENPLAGFSPAGI